MHYWKENITKPIIIDFWIKYINFKFKLNKLAKLLNIFLLDAKKLNSIWTLDKH